MVSGMIHPKNANSSRLRPLFSLVAISVGAYSDRGGLRPFQRQLYRIFDVQYHVVTVYNPNQNPLSFEPHQFSGLGVADDC